jgi:hypothetical protein
MDIDSYPQHFVAHTMHAAEIIGYKHPDQKMKSWWTCFYKKMVKGFHLNFETEQQLDVRLGYTPAEKKELLEAQHKWDAGTGSSHGGRQRHYSGSS